MLEIFKTFGDKIHWRIQYKKFHPSSGENELESIVFLCAVQKSDANVKHLGFSQSYQWFSEVDYVHIL